MYSKNIRIVLLKRVQLWRKGITEPIIRDTTLASAHLRYYNEYSEGITLLRGSVRAGAEGKESSWCVKGIAETQVSSQPSKCSGRRVDCLVVHSIS